MYYGSRDINYHGILQFVEVFSDSRMTLLGESQYKEIEMTSLK